ncbi:hypothetical protein TrispH2_005992 [Trichoplax sp. H2]|nr:hypothetical protein TrispH2_005992 [Trichoplax sp. H2]|eukprot:RDD42050.1 hypothetical protein TrispH2_005992 [Trichoplax sp. H2]
MNPCQSEDKAHHSRYKKVRFSTNLTNCKRFKSNNQKEPTQDDGDQTLLIVQTQDFDEMQ